MCQQSYHDFFAGGNVESGVASAERSEGRLLLLQLLLGGWAEVDLGETAEDQGRRKASTVTAVAQLLSGVTTGRRRRGRLGTGRVQGSRELVVVKVGLRTGQRRLRTEMCGLGLRRRRLADYGGQRGDGGNGGT